MPKVITSPLPQWSGTVTLHDPLTLPQVEQFEAGLDIHTGESERVFLTVIDRQQIPGILACVEKWELANFPKEPTLETFPMTPRKASHGLVAWLFGEIQKIYTGELDIPNE